MKLIKIFDLFEQTAILYPNRIAIKFQNYSLTYEKLYKKVNTIASIIPRGSKLIAVHLKRTPDLLASILTFYKCGITYLPIDPCYPKDRIEFMLKDSKAPTMLLQTDYPYENDSIKALYIKKTGYSIDESIYSGLAYIIYTSGSTGKPKGVMIKQEGLINLIEGMSERINYKAGYKIACFTTVSFDMFFIESIMALCKGLTVVLTDQNEQNNVRQTAKIIEENAIDIIQMTASRMQLLIYYDKELSCLKSVKEIIVGAEPVPLKLIQTLQKKTTANIYNFYGPTEVSIWSTISDLTISKTVDIGKPIKNINIYIFDENLNQVPNGEAGELCIDGIGLAKGYLYLDDLTKEKFVNNPNKTNTIMYRTGDYARYLADGNIEYIGRLDNQVKIRGYRIELEEVETIANQYDGIGQAIASVYKTDYNSIICLHYTSEYEINENLLNQYITNKLPEYMVPSWFIKAPKFNYSQNGKIDRKSLYYPDISKISINSDSMLMSDIQQKVIEFINEIIMNIEVQITLNTEMTSIGLDSILFVRLVIAIEEEFGFEFDDEMMAYTTLKTVGDFIEYVESKASSKVEVLV